MTNLDLNGLLVIDPASALGPLAEANAPLKLVLGQLTKPLADAVAGTPLGTTGISGTLGVVEGSCTAGPGTASGDATIANSKLILDLAGQKLVLANLPANPPPNTEVPIDLEKATAVITGAVKTQLETMLAAPGAASGPLAPLAALPELLQTQVIEAVVNATRAQLLEPLGDNVFNLVLNRQIRIGDDAIKVRAFDLNVIPAAAQAVGASLVNLQIGNAACGPSGRVQAAPAAPKATASPTALPTAVSAGYSSTPDRSTQGDDSTNTIVLGAFALLVTVGAGFVSYRRLRA